jgi:hypothetical protein
MRSIIFTTILVLSLNTAALEVRNFKSGPACTDNESFGWICHNTKDIYITGQGSCTWNGETKPCSWYGFEFDYSGNKEEVSIQCSYVMSESGSEGNPNEVIREKSNSGSYEIKLTKENGHFYNPQYTLLSSQVKEKALVKSDTICTVNGSTVFEFGYNFHFPTIE